MDVPKLLPNLEPPPGGLTQLRARLEAKTRRRRRFLPLWVPAVVAVAVLLMLRFPPMETPGPEAPVFTAARQSVALGFLEEGPAVSSSDPDVGFLSVQETDGILFYRRMDLDLP